MKKFKPYLEMAVLLAVVYGLGFWLHPKDPFFNHFTLSPYLLLVIIGAVKYGSPVGLILGIICALIDISSAVAGDYQSLRDVLFLDPVLLLHGAGCIAVGHFIGEAVHSAKMKSAFLQEQADRNKNLADSLAGEKAGLEVQYRKLESKVAVESRSSYSFIKSLMKFDTLEPKMVTEYAVLLAEKYLKARRVEYWIKEENKWERVFPEIDAKQELPAPYPLLLKSEELNTLATCRDYPELAVQSGIDLALCWNSTRTPTVHALACMDIPFTEWGLQLQEIIRTILREATAAADFWSLKFSLGEVAPIEARLRVESLHLFKNQVKRQLLTLSRNQSTSVMMFVAVEEVMTKDIRVLGVIASCLRSVLRVSDTISFGQEGNYFVLFLPQTPGEGAQIVADKINVALDTLQLYPQQQAINLDIVYYELTEASLLEKVFADYHEDMPV